MARLFFEVRTFKILSPTHFSSPLSLFSRYCIRTFHSFFFFERGPGTNYKRIKKRKLNWSEDAKTRLNVGFNFICPRVQNLIQAKCVQNLIFKNCVTTVRHTWFWRASKESTVAAKRRGRNKNEMVIANRLWKIPLFGRKVLVPPLNNMALKRIAKSAQVFFFTKTAVGEYDVNISWVSWGNILKT